MAEKLNKLNDKQKQILSGMTTNDILELFSSGRITLGQRDNLLDSKYELTKKELLESVGLVNFPVKTFMRQVDIINEAWTNIKAVIQETQAKKRKGKGTPREAELLLENSRILFNGLRVFFAAPEAAFQAIAGRGLKGVARLFGASEGVAEAAQTVGEFGDVVFLSAVKALALGKLVKLGVGAAAKAAATSTAKTAKVAAGIKGELATAARKTAEGDEEAIGVVSTTITNMLKSEGLITTQDDIAKLINQGLPPRLRVASAAVAGTKLTPDAKAMQRVLERRGIKTAEISRTEVAPGQVESLDEAVRNEFMRQQLADPSIADDLMMAAPNVSPPIRINADDVFADVVRKVQDNLATQTRKTEAAMEYFQKSTSFTLDDIANFEPGTILPKEQIEVVISTVRQELTTYVELAKRAVLTGNTRLVDHLIDRANGITRATAATLGIRAETGRGLGIMGEALEFGGQIIDDMNNTLMKLLPDLAGDPSQLNKAKLEFLTQVARLDPDKSMTLFLQRLRPGRWNQFKELYRNVLLPKPISIFRNIAGPVSFAFGHTAERAAAGVIGKEVGGREFMDWWTGLYRSYFGAKASALEVFAERALPRAAMTEVERGGRFAMGQIPGKLGKAGRLPQRAFGATDEFFNSSFSGGDLYARAAKAADDGGLQRGTDAFEDFITRFIATADDEVITASRRLGRELTLTAPLGPFGKKIQDLVQTGPGFVFTPFFRTFVDANKAVFQRFPGLAAVSPRNLKDLSAGGRAADFAAVRVMESFILGNLFFSMARSGQFTGGGPKDPNQNRNWRNAGNVPYSVQTRFGPVPYLQFLPYSIPMAIIADTAAGFDDTPNDATDQALAAAMVALSRVDHTLLDNNRNLVSMANSFTPKSQADFDRVIETLQAPIVTAATGGPLGDAVLKAVDNIRDPEEARVMREARTLMEEVRRRWPNSGLTPVFDDLGRAVTREQFRGPPVVREMLPLVITPREPNVGDDALDALRKLNVGDLRAPRSLGSAPTDNLLDTQNVENAGGINLTDEEFARYNEIYNTTKLLGKTLTEHVLDINQSNLFPTDANKRQEILNRHRSVLSIAKVQLFKEFPNLFTEAEKAKVRAQLEFLPDDIRPQIRQQIDESIDQLGQSQPFSGVQLDFAEPGFSRPPIE